MKWRVVPRTRRGSLIPGERTRAETSRRHRRRRPAVGVSEMFELVLFVWVYVGLLAILGSQLAKSDTRLPRTRSAYAARRDRR